MQKFLDQIQKFNLMYKIPMSEKPTLPSSDELKKFRSILIEELLEVDEIIDKLSVLEVIEDEDSLQSDHFKTLSDSAKLRLKADIADWHGDMIVYCHTHAAKYGLPMDKILDIIMESNFSKLGADGKPIYDERGKVEKGPNFYAPEPELIKLIEAISDEK